MTGLPGCCAPDRRIRRCFGRIRTGEAGTDDHRHARSHALERADDRMRPHGFWAFGPGFEREITHMRLVQREMNEWLVQSRLDGRMASRGRSV
ncbi:hypothetical protein [Nonomuraea sp. NPDC005692]|uniref:hypothetical protein n=1 Tax=Nonomuraea sp. NPDC005692 TaxID=3157168 RepID=UPI00340B54E6